MSKIKYLSVVIILFMVSSCAMYYRPIAPERLNYNIRDKYDDIEISYRYDVLKERGNKKMAKKELNGDVKIIALKITNNSDSVIKIGEDAEFYSGITPIYPLDPNVIKNNVKQSVFGYSFYFLGVLGGTTFSVNGNVVSQFPYNKILFSAIAIGNMLVANKANNDLLKELVTYDIMYKEIKPGETVYGIIGIKDRSFIPITLKMINK